LLQRVLVVFAIAVLAGCAPEKPTPNVAAANRLAKPFPLDPFVATDLDGRTVSLAAWKGQVVVVNVWATWCAPCRRELPVLAALQTKYQERVRVLGILQDNVTDEFARQFAKQARLNFPVIRSTFEIESRLPAIAVIPMTFVIDSAGNLVSMFAGEADARELEQELIRLVGAPGL